MAESVPASAVTTSLISIGTLRHSQGSIEEVLERAIAAKPEGS